MPDNIKYITTQGLEKERTYDYKTRHALEYFKSTPYHLRDKQKKEVDKDGKASKM